MRKDLSSLLVLMVFQLSLCFVAAAQHQDLRNGSKPLVALIPADLPPTYFRDPQSGEPAGLAIDVTNAIARIAGVSIEYRFAKPWDEIETFLLEGKADLIPFRVINSKTLARFIFTENLENSKINYIVRSSDLSATNSPTGRSVGFIKGSVADVFLKDRTDLQKTSFESFQEMLLGLLSGKIDMVLAPPENFLYLAEMADLEDRLRVLEPPVTETKRAIALLPANTALRDRLNRAIEEFNKSEEAGRLYQKWLHHRATTWTTRQVEFLIGSVVLLILLPLLTWHYVSLRRFTLRLTEERSFLVMMMDAIPDFVFFKDSAGKYLGCNQSFAERFFGRSRQDILGKTDPESGCEKKLAGLFHDKEQEALTAGKTCRSDEWLSLGDGKQILVETTRTPFCDANGKISGLIGVSRDITKRVMAEEQYRILIQHSHNIIFTINLEGVLIFVSPSWKKLLGHEPADVMGKNFRQFMHSEDIPMCETALRTLSETGVTPTSLEYRLFHQDGSIRWHRTTIVPVFGASHSILQVVGNAEDFSDRKRAEEILARSEEKFKTVANFTADWEYWIAPDKTIVYMSPSCETLTGYASQDFVQAPELLQNIVHPEDRPAVEGHFLEVSPANGHETHDLIEFRIIRRDGNIRWLSHICRPVFSDNGAFLGRRVSNRDMTDFKRAVEDRLAIERKMLQTQKLESLGVLAGGIAHDFNNILTAITGNADLALFSLDPSSPAADSLNAIQKAASRAADLAKQMLAYSGKGKFLIENVDLGAIIQEMSPLLQASISKRNELRLVLSGGDPSAASESRPLIHADVTQLRQVLMNLVINASEAIGDHSGIITVTTGARTFDGEALLAEGLQEQMSEGSYSSLEISDTGCGMDHQTISRIFDPFFTTKFTGRGLGLAAVLGIIRGHKGGIKVISQPGKGTTFKVFFPVSNKPLEKVSSSEKEPSTWKGHGVILLIDDEEAICKTGTRMLKLLGFDSLVANDGLKGLELFRLHQQRIVAIILDLTMPNMDGAECLHEIRKLDADSRIFLSSGFSEQEVSSRFHQEKPTGFIQKPYALSDLRELFKAHLPPASSEASHSS